VDGERTLGDLLIEYRRMAGFSQQQLADQSGVRASTISDIERGISRTPRPFTLRTLADTLKLSAAERRRFLAAGLPVSAADPVEVTSAAPADVTPDHQPDPIGTVPPGDYPASTPDPYGALLTLAAMLARLRRRAGLSVPDLAHQSGLSSRTIWNVEKGRTTRILPQSARLLADALGLTDSEQRRVFFALAAGEEVPVAGLTGTRMSAPVVPSGLQGRVREFGDLIAWLRGPGLVTITGPGGIGKTALAMAAQETLGGSRRPLEFALLPAGSDATAGLAKLAGLDEGPRVLDVVADSLEEASLLVMDNLEHLTGIAGMITGLLERRPDIRLLATSRLGLGIDGERVITLRTLDPDAARTMFEAVAARAGGSVHADAAGVIDAVCARLDGLPLAIELAAAWSAMLTPQDILEQLDQPGRLLRRPGPDRQASITNMVDWSLRLLGASAVMLFKELSVYPASWPLHLIDAVHEEPDMLDSLQQLTASGLVRVDRSGSSSRFGMFQTVQDVGRSLIHTDKDQADAVLRRHAMHLVQLALELAPDLTGYDSAKAMAQLGDDYLHYESALRYLTAIADPHAIQMSAALWRYWQHMGKYRAGLALIRPALDACGNEDPGPAAECWYGCGVLAYLSGDIDLATSYARTALDLFREQDDAGGAGGVMSLLGMISLYLGDVDGAVRWYTDGLRIATWQAAPRAHATLLSNFALVREEQADLVAASKLAEQAAIRYRLLGDMRGVAAQLGNLGTWSGQLGDTERALDLLNETRQIFTELHDSNGLREVYHRLTEIALNEGSLAEAASTLELADQHGRELDDPWGDSTAGGFAAELLIHLGDLTGAAREAQLAAARAAALNWHIAAIRAWLVQTVSLAGQGRPDEALHAARSGLLLCTAAHAAAITSFSLVIAAQRPGDPDSVELANAAGALAANPSARPYAMVALVVPLPAARPLSDGGRVTPEEVRERALALCGTDDDQAGPTPQPPG
jgi:predicted ATPase/transcriptional regulator with XRE-family HTH domain